MGPNLSVVLPAFNEAENIAESIRRSASALLRLAHEGAVADWEIVVVDDGSLDGTVSVARAVGESRLKIVMHAGGGAA